MRKTLLCLAVCGAGLSSQVGGINSLDDIDVPDTESDKIVVFSPHDVAIESALECQKQGEIREKCAQIFRDKVREIYVTVPIEDSVTFVQRDTFITVPETLTFGSITSLPQEIREKANQEAQHCINRKKKISRCLQVLLKTIAINRAQMQQDMNQFTATSASQ